MQRRFKYIKYSIDLLHKSSPDGRLGRLLAATRWRVSALLRYRLCEREGCDVMTGRPLVDAQAELGDHGEDVVEDVCLDGLVDRPARVVREHVDLDRHALGCGCELPHEEGHFLVDARVLTQVRDDVGAQCTDVGEAP